VTGVAATVAAAIAATVAPNAAYFLLAATENGLGGAIAWPDARRLAYVGE
jgi:hypothetical protein